MITQIEQALVDRLTRGLGQLARTVKTYGGELEDSRLGTSPLPGVFITYGGSTIKGKNVARLRYQSISTVAIIVAVRSLRSDQAGRHGGVSRYEIGANQLITAVRRLLDSQTLGGLTLPLKPVRIRTLYNHAEVRNEILTAYAIEYEAVYNDIEPLEDGRFPEFTIDSQQPDFIFSDYYGEHSTPYEDLLRMGGEVTNTSSELSQSIFVERPDND